ncbi:MAG TPA: MerR family transcriptional regulator [Planctomycetota bacterium]|nr:MerR family transcriptional regulator [Planctomycetota bacterium]
MAASDLIKIGEFAKLAGTNLRTLRYYEELGLLAPAARSHGGFRYYRHVDLNRLRLIRDLQGLGLHLERIGELLAGPRRAKDRGEFIQRVRAALREHDRLLAERVREIEGQRRGLSEALEKLKDCAGCVHTPGESNNHCEPCSITGEHLPPVVSALF